MSLRPRKRVRTLDLEKEMAKIKGQTIGIAVVIGLVALVITGVIPLGLQEATPEETALTEQAACNIDDQIGVRTIPEDVFTKGTSVDVSTNLYTTGLQRLDTAADQSNLDASALTEYVIFAYDDATANCDAGADWYGVMQTIDTDCKDPFDVYFEMYKESNPTLTVWNDDGSPNTNDNNVKEQNMTAGTDYEVEFKVKAPNDAAFGAPGSNVDVLICVDYNATAYDNVEIEGASKTDVPDHDLTTSEKCYAVGRDTFKDTLTGREEQTFTMLIETDDAQGVLGTQSGDINIRLMDAALFINTETGEPMYDIQDQDGADVGLATSTLDTLHAGG